MSVQVQIPASLSRLYEGLPRATTAEGSTVHEVLLDLDRRWPGVRDRLVDSQPAIRQHIMLFVADERAGLATVTPPGSTLQIVPSISGG